MPAYNNIEKVRYLCLLPIILAGSIESGVCNTALSVTINSGGGLSSSSGYSTRSSIGQLSGGFLNGSRHKTLCNVLAIIDVDNDGSIGLSVFHPEANLDCYLPIMY